MTRGTLLSMNEIARVCHEVNRAYCQALGDNSQPAWDDAPEWQRSSARMGVDLHTMGDFGPEASHISWMKQKLDEGWKYGPVKDPEKKEHPCIVPFAELPREQQAKDFIFRAVVHALRGQGMTAAKADGGIGMLRAALVGLVGADTEAELKQMETAMRLLPAPEADKAVSINAIHALLATMPVAAD
ncbi:MAG: RyR domain-containing protein [Hyphomicrobium sp.]